ncbi:MAG: diaminopimelate decarboxylase [Micrococcales bacterium]|nr:diaminopimelate decarboxylase [Micrococcales bacterium]
MRAHEAGALHAEGYRGPAWLSTPSDVNALAPSLWAGSVGRGGDGVLTVGGVSATELAREHGTPAYVIDEDDFRTRAKAFRLAYGAAFGGLAGADVYYAGKAFLCTEIVRWIDADGLRLDVCTGGELAVAQRAGLPGERIGMHGNNKSVAEIRAALEYGVGRIVIDSFEEIERVSRVAAELGIVAPVLVRVTVGVEAHTHEFIATAHEDQKFGLSLAGGQAFEAARRITARPQTLRLLGLHSHIGSQIFDVAGFEVSARRVLGLHARVTTELGVELPELDLGGGFGISYTTEHDPLTPELLAAGMAEIVERECRAGAMAIPRISIEPGRAIAGPSTLTLYEVGTVKTVDLDGGASRFYVSVDGGMSDNVRTALYAANYSCTVAGRLSAAAPVLARVVGKHCESGDIVVMDEFLPSDVAPGDLIAVPATGAYCRSLSSQYNHTPRPPVVAVREGGSRIIVRRETIEDILALDV